MAWHEWPIMLMVVAMIVAPCLAVFAIGMRLKRRLVKSSPESQLVRKLKASEVISGLSFVTCLVASLAIMRLTPLVEDGTSRVLPLRAFLEIGLVWLAFSLVHILVAVGERAIGRRKGAGN